jgi:DNA-directed RNA polymerase specialized sigma24 family protein
MSVTFEQEISELKTPDDYKAERDSYRDLAGLVGSVCRRAVPNPPPGLDYDDMMQDYFLDVLEHGENPFMPQFIDIGYRAIDSARTEGRMAMPGNSAYVRTYKDLLDSKPITRNSGVLGQAAQRRALARFNGVAYPDTDADTDLDLDGNSECYNGDQAKDIFGVPIAIINDPSDLIESQIISQILETIPRFKDSERNQKVIKMYLDGWRIPEIALRMDLPHGTAKSIWNSFRLEAQALLTEHGYTPAG